MDKGYKIRILRESKGISQKQVALGLNITQSAYSKMEACEERISMENCKKIAELIGVNVLEIFEFDQHYEFMSKKAFTEVAELKAKQQELIKELEILKNENRTLIKILDLVSSKA